MGSIRAWKALKVESDFDTTTQETQNVLENLKSEESLVILHNIFGLD